MENFEIWKDCKGYENLYQVSSFGRVWDVRQQKVLKPIKTNKGTLTVHLKAKNGRIKYEYVHRLAALVFVPNEEHKSFVNHKDGDKSNNYIDNLEWCDASA